ncbi:ATP-binding protein [Streptomyces kaniharaensis]|uniref:ATP-binding protein n=1 Tax=Streptomyces kaniharaensis TaxID=212423 RepID=UPI0018A7F0C6|nr:ATP-binding protein [Streptomyces kaniharaensis]
MCTLNSPSLALARQSLRDGLTRAGWDAETILNAELALAELVVNAWRHGATASPVVFYSLLGCTLRVSVSDESDALPEQRAPADLAETGRGLQLVQGLTHRWGVDPQKRGKSVWYELDFAA